VSTVSAAINKKSGYQFHKSILREYDIRGIVGETLGEDDAYNIGRAYATFMIEYSGKSSLKICVGRDGRISSPVLEPRLIQGLIDGGAEVHQIGLGPTPMLYFSVFEMGADGGIMVTGSHNPPTHNGFKMMMGKKSLFGDNIKKLGEIAASGEYVSAAGKLVGAEHIKAAYIKRLLASYTSKKSLKVAWDPGNGAAGEITELLVKQLPGQHFTINTEIDGTFPAHHPDPTVEKNLEQLKQLVLKEGCDIGIAFDGDADRIGIVDGQGRPIWGDQMVLIYAREILSRTPGAVIIADVKASQTLFDEVEALGGKPLMWKTGHSLIKSKMQETGAPMAGEMSGHIFFADGYLGFDDGVYSAVRMLNILAESPQSITEIYNGFPKTYSTPETRIECSEERKFQIAEEIKARLHKVGAKFSDIDGVRVNTSDGWWLLRASNTSAVLVSRCESTTAEGLAKLEASLIQQLELSGIDYHTRGDH